MLNRVTMTSRRSSPNAFTNPPRQQGTPPQQAANESDVVISVRAKPRSSVSSLELDDQGIWIARLRSSPVDGKANAELIALVAAHFDCPKSSVTVISGATARLKLVRIGGKRHQ